MKILFLPRLLLISLLLLSGCSTRYKHKVPYKKYHSSQNVSSSAQNISKKHYARGTILDKLYTQYRHWRGTPYLFGGNSQKGVDCSAFIQNTYLVQFHLKLPRTTKDQVRVGRSVSKSQLRAGDLVFFKTGRHTRHVGIYLENGSFMHASTSQGITISSLKEKYWRNHYWRARRVLH